MAATRRGAAPSPSPPSPSALPSATEAGGAAAGGAGGAYRGHTPPAATTASESPAMLYSFWRLAGSAVAR